MIPGGSEPDWGPADVPAARAEQPGPGPGPGGEGAALAAKVRRASLRKGLVVKTTVPGPGRLSAVARHRGKKVAKARARPVEAGSHAVRVKFTKAGRRTLRRAGRRPKVTVRVTFAPSGGPKQRTTVRAVVKRR